MTVTVLTCSAADILHSKIPTGSDSQQVIGKLTIPEYQRPYCWQDKQLAQLLADIKAHNEQNKQTPELPYYLGSLILHQSNGQLNIIDGQQRVTTLALMSCISGSSANIDLSFESPISQQQIKHNLAWLQRRADSVRATIAMERLQFTLVVTRSEDDAYRFFETQNTGGVRLGGPDIIKAHHLRAVEKLHQLQFAKTWEALGELDDVINSLLKGRYWQLLKHRELPSHQQQKQLRDAVVWELAQQTGYGPDLAYGRVSRQKGLSGDMFLQSAQQGYDVRQPLNQGVNSIHYLAYFQALYNRYWREPDLPHLQGYQQFIAWLKQQEGCGYLHGLYETCLMLYISQFGEHQLEQAAKKLFRVVYSRRVSNQKAVREQTVPAFTRDTPVLDWIALSYTPEQCFDLLDAFTLIVEGSNLNINSTKKRFMDSVVKHFKLAIAPDNYQKDFAQALTLAITGTCND
uniref:DUF262 domain-containing protein n=1 Tax=Rheinheimera sp. TaxID=1869214 RepID=UPI004047AAC1